MFEDEDGPQNRKKARSSSDRATRHTENNDNFDEPKQSEGIDIDDAVDAAIKARTAPVLLTTVTTVLGLLTLAFSESTLWPPMAWAIISGLLMSTLLTLLVIPILSRTFLRSKAI